MKIDNALTIAWWFMYDDCECELEQAIKHLEGASKEKHGGDCTNMAYTCMRCQYEDAEKLAERIRSKGLA